jgi:hypothetical protein
MTERRRTLFEDTAPIRALEDFLLGEMGRRRTGDQRFK